MILVGWLGFAVYASVLAPVHTPVHTLTHMGGYVGIAAFAYLVVRLQ